MSWKLLSVPEVLRCILKQLPGNVLVSYKFQYIVESLLNSVCVDCTSPASGFRSTFGCWTMMTTTEGRLIWEPRGSWQIFPPGLKSSWIGMASLSPSDPSNPASALFTVWLSFELADLPNRRSTFTPFHCVHFCSATQVQASRRSPGEKKKKLFYSFKNLKGAHLRWISQFFGTNPTSNSSEWCFKMYSFNLCGWASL